MATVMASSVGILSSRTHLSSSTRQPISPSLKTTSFASVPDLRFVCSQLSGLQISHTHSAHLVRPICVPPTKLPLQPVARRICPFTGKKANKANRVSHSNHKTKRLQFVNLQYKRIWWEAGNRFVKLRLSTKAIKTIEKNGLDAVAKKAGIDLRKL
ncbi:hypothetical protein ACET3Z_002043 [Daucus carota]